MILWKNDPRRGRVVVGCCERSARLGVRPAIAIAQATELVRRASSQQQTEICEPIAIEHDPVADRIALEKVVDQIQATVTPMVAIETVPKRPWAGMLLAEPETILCDLSGVTHLFDDEQGVLRTVHQLLAATFLAGRLAIADNAAAAWAHSHYNPTPDFVSQDLVNDLVALSVNGLRIETETKYTLDRLGITTIGALLRLPRAGLARRLGEPLLQRISEASGEIELPLDVQHLEQQVASTCELEYPTDDQEIIGYHLEQVVEKVVASLATNQRGALRLVCRLDLIGRSQLSTTIGLFAPTLDGKHLHQLVNSSVETLKLSTPVRQLTLIVLQSEPLRSRQNSLFAQTEFALSDKTHADRSLAQLVDSLSGRLGRDAVLGVRLANNPLPERAFKTYSLTDHHTRRSLAQLTSKRARVAGADAIRIAMSSDARRRPLRLLRRPIELAVTPKSKDQGQSLPQLSYQGNTHQVMYWWGPERIETGWWEGPTVRRDYYRIETDRGELWWVYRDLKSGSWFLHGRFT